MSDLKEGIKRFREKYDTIRDKLSNEEQTKNALIMPFFQMLGWDVFNPLEFVPEYIADFGIKKGEKVDYAIIVNEEPVILIEAKSITEDLDRHDGQLFRYFGTTASKFGILTNGRVYKFYTDLDETNKMDSEPFLTIDIEKVRDAQLVELAKFEKENFNVDDIMSSAEELKYLNLMKDYLNHQFDKVDESFIKFCLDNIFNERKTVSNIERFEPVVTKALAQVINDKVSDKLNQALDSQNITVTNENKEEVIETNEDTDGVETTDLELEFFSIVKFLLQDYVDPERIFYRDNLSYFNILLDDNIRKWFIRLYTKKSGLEVVFRDGDKIFIDSPLEMKNYLSKMKDNIEELM